MLTENLSTLKIHKLTQEQYDRELAAGNIDESALYLTPDVVLDVEVAISEDGLLSLVDATPMQVVDAIDNGASVRLYMTVSTDEVRYYSMNGRGTNSFGEYIDFVYSNFIEVDTITISQNGRNSTIGRFVTPYDNSDVVIPPTTAEVGQTIIVKAVDENGKPIEWEAVDNLRYVASDTEPDDKNVVWIDTSDSSVDFEQVVIDPTLTQSGWAADAKKTGDAIKSKADLEYVLDLENNKMTRIDSSLQTAGKAADAKATGDAISNLSTQLSSLIHVGSTEPTNVVDGMVWVDTSESQHTNNEVI